MTHSKKHQSGMLADWKIRNKAFLIDWSNLPLANLPNLDSANPTQIKSLNYLLHGLQTANAFDGPVFLKGSPGMPTYTKRRLQGCNIVW